MAFEEDRTKGPYPSPEGPAPVTRGRQARNDQAPRGTGTAVTMMLSW